MSETVTSPEIADLKFRLDLGTHLIRMLESSDLTPEQKAASVEKLQGQQRRINERLVAAIAAQRKAMGIPEPKPVVVSLKPMQMKARIFKPQQEVNHGRG